jgi:hypothetical protein
MFCPTAQRPHETPGEGHRSHAAAALSSLSAPRITILSASSGSGRCEALASSHGARVRTSRSSSVIRIAGTAFGWIGSTTPLAHGCRFGSTDNGKPDPEPRAAVIAIFGRDAPVVRFDNGARDG